jgi:xeroderma pigmentosum group C-complementing protein
VAIFKKKFKITHRGLSAPVWQDLEALKNWSPPRGTELITKEAFIKASKTLTGSRDLGAQLFCALLRSAGITTRLVCSLQLLPFDFATKQKPPAPPLASISNNSSASEPASPASPAPRRTGGLRRPLLRTPVVTPKPKPPAPKAELLPESSVPVVWVEAWSTASQRWITIDPLVTCSVARPQNLEPALSDPLNTLSYAIAFEDTGHAVDVTRRYAKWFSAKTRRWRVTSTKDGEKWYKRLIRKFRRGFEIDRDQLEQAEFSRLQLQEPVPNAVQDLKDHPLFALKRHLRRNEVIHPERKAGSVKTAKGGVETIFRRQDVKEVRTHEQWYKVGRMVKADEIPLKFTTARKMRKREEDAGDEEPPPHQPMFSIEQTEIYTPPPVVNGLVPKNRFGNLDVFVPSMVPPGGIHIQHPLARNAARIVDVDYSDAVAGFEFRNRMANPVFKGVVVADIYKEAVEAVVEGLEYEKEREVQWERAREALRLWRRWILRLRIRQRLGVGTDEAVELRLPGEVERRMEDGGAARSKGKKVAAKRKTRRRVEEFEDEEEEEEEEAVDDGVFADSDEGGGFVRGDERDVSEDEYASRANEDGSYPPDMDAEGGGGFVPEDYDHTVLGGGGFIAEAKDVGSGFIPDDVGGGFVCEQDAPEVHLRPEENDEDAVPESAAEYLGGEFVCEQDAPEIHLHNEECPNAEDIRGGGFLPDADAPEATPVAAPSEILAGERVGDGGFVAEANETTAQEVSSSQEKQREGSYDEQEDEDEEDLDWELYGL